MWYTAPADPCGSTAEPPITETRTSTQLLNDLHDPAHTGSWALFNQRYHPIIISYARNRGIQPAGAEDVAQETLIEFLSAYRAGRYDRARGARLSDWLKGIAANRVREFTRRTARTKERQAPDNESRTGFFEKVAE